MKMRGINLVFCVKGRLPGIVEDFKEIARRIEAVAPDISVTLMHDKTWKFHRLYYVPLAMRPTLFIETWIPRRDYLLRGARLSRKKFGSKIEEFQAIEGAGLPIPKWTEIKAGIDFDPREWGAYVVEKPAVGKKGNGVRIRKTGRVRYRPSFEYPEGHPGRKGPMIAQKFIYTGPLPVSYRVMTYLGEPILCYRHEGDPSATPLPSADAFRSAGGGMSIVATTVGCVCSLSDEQDIIDLATRTHAALPVGPYLGIDIIREHGTGKLYVLEINPDYPSWSFSSRDGRSIQKKFDLDFYNQFGMFDVVANKSIAAARQLAR